MPVVRLVAKSNSETIQTLEWMLQEARRGKLNDFLSSFRHDNEGEQAAFTGVYKADSAKALMAVMRMSAMLTKGQDQVSGPP